MQVGFPAVGFMSVGAIIRGVTFDGTNDYMLRGADLTGNGDSSTGIFSCWVKFNGGDGTAQRIYSSTSGFVEIYKDTSNKINVLGCDSGGTTRLLLVSSNSYTVSSGWIHILASWDIAALTAQLYINDVVDQASTTATNFNIDYTRANHAIGAQVGAGDKLNADIAAFYFNFGTSLNLSTASNRRKFIDDNKYPVLLGSNGATPTGSSPIMYFNLDDGAAVSSFVTNKGTGGGMTLTGTLTESTTNPHA